MRQYNNSVILKFDTKATGNAGSSKLVTVRIADGVGGGAKADLFNDELVPISNPVTTDEDGNYSFNVDDGTYDLIVSEGLPGQTIIPFEQIVNSIDNIPTDVSQLIARYTLVEAKSLVSAEIGQIVQITDLNNQQYQYVSPTVNDGFKTIEAEGSSLTLLSLTKGLVSIEDYQIPLNNTANFDVNFQALIDEHDRIDLAGSIMTYYTTLYFREGTKVYNGTLRQADTFTGDLKQTNYAGSGPYDNYPGIYAENKDDIKFVNVELDGNNGGRAAPVGSSSSIVMLVNCNDAKFKDCDTHNNVADQATLQGGAIFMLGGEGHSYIGGKIHDIQDEGWHTRSNYTTVRGTRLNGSTSSLVGSQLFNGESGNFAKGLVVVDCPEVKGCPNGAAISANHLNSIVSNNIIEDSKHAIIFGHRSSFARRSPATGSTATGNSIKNITSAAIQMQYGKSINVTGGSIVDSGTDNNVTSSYAILATSWCGGGTIADVTIDGGAGGVLLSADTSDGDETVIPNWSVSNVDMDNILGYGIRSNDCSGDVNIKGNTLKKVNTSLVSSRGGIVVFTDYNNMEGSTPNVVVKGNSIGSNDVDCQRSVSISISNQPDTVVRHKVTDNDAINAANGFVFSPPSLVLSVNNYLDSVNV